MSIQNLPIHLDSSRQDHPVLSGQVGALENLLYKCLVTGFNAQIVTEITRSGSTATVTLSAHGFTDYDVVNISGANETEYNGTFVVLPGASSSQFSYTVTGTPSSPATGTITAKFQPLGWTRELNNSNKSLFKSDAGSSGSILRLDDSGAIGTQSYRVAFTRGGYGYIDIDTLTTPIFPKASQLTNGLVIHKSSTLDSTERLWDIYGNGRFFLLATAHHASYTGTYEVFWFGDVISEVVSPAYPSVIVGCESDSLTSISYFSALGSLVNVNTSKYTATQYNQTGDPQYFGTFYTTGQSYMGSGGMSSPSPVNSGYTIAEAPICSQNVLIGKFPGIWIPWHNIPLSHRSIFPEFPSLPGRRLMGLAIPAAGLSSDCRVIIDLTGPLY